MLFFYRHFCFNYGIRHVLLCGMKSLSRGQIKASNKIHYRKQMSQFVISIKTSKDLFCQCSSVDHSSSLSKVLTKGDTEESFFISPKSRQVCPSCQDYFFSTAFIKQLWWWPFNSTNIIKLELKNAYYSEKHCNRLSLWVMCLDFLINCPLNILVSGLCWGPVKQQIEYVIPRLVGFSAQRLTLTTNCSIIKWMMALNWILCVNSVCEF